MISIQNMDHLNLFVKDLDKSLEFYGKMFGFSIKEDGKWKGEPYVITGISGKLMLAMYQKKELPEKGRINHFGIHVTNFEAVLDQVKEQGIETLYGGSVDGTVTYPGSRSVYIVDPDGNEIELSEVFGGGL